MNLNSTAATCIKNVMWHLESLRKIAIIGPESVSVRGDTGSCGIFLCQSHSVFGFAVSFKFQLPITLFLILSAQLDTNSPLVSFKWKQIQAWLFCQLREWKQLAFLQWFWKCVQLSHAFVSQALNPFLLTRRFFFSSFAKANFQTRIILLTFERSHQMSEWSRVAVNG